MMNSFNVKLHVLVLSMGRSYCIFNIMRPKTPVKSKQFFSPIQPKEKKKGSSTTSLKSVVRGEGMSQATKAMMEFSRPEARKEGLGASEEAIQGNFS